MISVTISVCCSLFLTIVSIFYFSKKRVDNMDNRIFAILLVSNIIGTLIDIFGFISFNHLSSDNILNILISKVYLIHFIFYSFCLMMYIFNLTYNNKKILKLLIKPFIAICLVDFLLPIKVYLKKNIAYSYGISVDFAYFIGFIIILIMILLLIKNRKNIKNKVFIPLLAFIILIFLTIVIQKINPALTLLLLTYSLVTFLMFFTIENPDVKMIQELEVAREEADKANRAKTDFLSSMSHEIRTPLNAIVGFSDYIMTSEALEEAKENAQDIVNASNTLLEIVNGILDISKIEAGKLEIINSKYNAHQTFEGLAKLISPKMLEKGLDFSYYIAPDIPDTLFGDHSNIKKVITNLLSNACKYTDKGFVRYEVNCVKNMDTCKLIISVEDSGRGIKQENIDKLFNKFQRLEEDRNTTVEGTGLGLAITKQLIELMGGKIIVHTVYKQGSKFTVMLNQRIEKKTEKLQIRKRTTLDLSGERILIVDDNALNLKVATKLLQQYHATEIECVESGFSCLEKIQEGKTYDVILLDDMMPKMSGVETLKKLKEIPSFKTPVIALTANAINGMREKYLRDGFNNYLAKPIDKEQLIQIMNEVLEKAPTEQLEIPPQRKEEIETLLPEETTIENYLKQKGVNLEKSLEFLGDMEMYQMTAEDFANEIDAKWKRIQKYKEEKDLENYAIEVHSLKSDAKYLGLTQLAEISYEHEIKSKEKDEEYIKRHFLELENAYQKSLEIEKEFLKRVKKKENS